MGGSQYLRDNRMAQHLTKTVELRKRVLEKNKKHNQKRDSVPFQVRLKEINNFDHFVTMNFKHFSGAHTLACLLRNSGNLSSQEMLVVT